MQTSSFCRLEYCFQLSHVSIAFTVCIKLGSKSSEVTIIFKTEFS